MVNTPKSTVGRRGSSMRAFTLWTGLLLGMGSVLGISGCYREIGPREPAPAGRRQARSTAASEAMPAGAELSRMVHRRLERTQAVDAADIRIFADDGIVTLTGAVDNLYARDRAAEVAGQVRDVRAVVNRIDLVGGGVPDDEIEGKIRQALRAGPTTRDAALDISVYRGRVRLSGDVGSLPVLRMAAAVASAVRGVREVDSRHVVIDTSKRTDEDIRHGLLHALREDPALDSEAIHVTVENGVVFLTGTAPSLKHVTHTRLLAQDAGAADVVANLDVDERVFDEDTRLVTHWKSDADVWRTVLDAFRHDPRLRSSRVEARVESGVVTLSGRVENAVARRAALADAASADGALQVVDVLRVQPGAASASVDRQVQRALGARPLVDTNRIAVSVYDGTVFLHGLVASYSERIEAERISKAVPGVVDVENALAVRKPRPLADEDAKLLAGIERRLTWDVAVDPGYVLVESEHGIVTLTGFVTNWEQFNDVLEDVYEVVRPVNVINHLEVGQTDGGQPPKYLETWAVPGSAMTRTEAASHQ